MAEVQVNNSQSDLVDALAERVELLIGSRLYSGWSEVAVERSLEGISGRFRLTLAEKGRATDSVLVVNAGDRCQLLIGGESVINGWIDAVEPSYASEDHAIAISGRDRTGDLADCAAIHKPGSWRNTSIEAIAAELTRPFGVVVSARVSTGAPLARFALQQGETVQAAIERLLRFRGLIAIADVDGNLEITTPTSAAAVAVLAEGRNILSASARHDMSERFSQYLVKGQASGNDEHHGKAVSAMSGTATDPGVSRYRPMLVVAEEQGDRASLATRAKWEAGVRAGRAISAEIDTLGWRVAKGGALWRPNMRVRVQSAKLKLDDVEMLVTGVRFNKSDGGTIASISVAPPGAWTQLAQPEGKAA